jgi:hypothetical protein
MSLRSAAMTAALVLATSSMAVAAMSMGPTKFTLHPQNHSGEVGNVTMTQDGDNVVVSVTTENGPDLAQPIHIHKGTCDTLDPKPTYPLTTLQKGESTTTLKNMTLAQLEDGGYAINIHHSTADVPTYYACGNIPKMKAM